MMTRRFLIASLVAASLAPVRAFAEDVPDFSGTWLLDEDASDSVDPILKAQGVSWFKRKIMGGLKLTQRIRQSGNTLDVTFVTSAKTQQHEWIVDGKPHVRTLDDGREATSTHRFEAGKLVSETTGISKGGDPYTLLATRSLEDGGQTAKVALVCTVKGQMFRVTRVFRRSA